MTIWGTQNNSSTSWAEQNKTVPSGLITEDALYFLSTEDDEVLLVEPAGGYWSYITRN